MSAGCNKPAMDRFYYCDDCQEMEWKYTLVAHENRMPEREEEEEEDDQ